MIKDICDVYDGPHATPKKTDKGPVYLGIRAISEDGTLSPNEFAFLSEEDYPKWTKRVTPIENDIVFSYEATLDRYAIIPKDFYGCLGRRLAVIRAKSADVNIKWLYYYFKSPEWKNYIANHIVIGSTVDRISIDDFPTYPVSLPERSEQDKAAQILGDIDRKIALNSTINAELNNIVRTLYDYWFTQFDFSDENGKPYRSSGGAMVWNKELKREIPKGWKSKTVRQCVSSINTGLNPRQNFKLGFGNNRYITIKNIENGRLDFSKCDVVDDDALKKIHNRSDISAGDILFTSIDPVGRLYWIRETPNEWDINESVFSIRPNTDIVATDYLYAVMDSEIFRLKLIPLRTGSVQKGIRIGALEEIFLAVPDRTVMKTFVSKVHPFYEEMGKLEKQNHELAELRDFLLPLLMNGQVRIVVTDVKAKEQIAITKEPTKREAVFKRLILSAYILDNICDEPTAGRVKFEKLLYLSEQCAQLPLHSEFQRAAAGPYDAKALYSIEDQLKQNKWFKRQKVKGESRAYTRLNKVDDYKQYVSANFDCKQKSVIDKLIELFKTCRTVHCEIVATLYGAWNDFLLEGIQPGDSQIVDEVLTNWNESKERIGRNRWLKAIKWMRDNEIVPVGYGVSTKVGNINS